MYLLRLKPGPLLPSSIVKSKLPWLTFEAGVYSEGALIQGNTIKYGNLTTGHSIV